MSLDTLNTVATYALIYGGTPAQTLFVGLYLFRPWRKYRPTRALMSKSFSFWLLLSQSFIVLHMYGLRPVEWPDWLMVYRIVGDAFMLWAIYYQLISLLLEIRSGYREDMLRRQAAP